MARPELSVVIPCLNEADGLRMLEGELFESLAGVGLPFEVLFVDDGSADGTSEVLAGIAARRPESRVLIHDRTRGMGAALKTGFQSASGSLIATLDADLSFHPRQLPRLLSRLREEGLDCVIGSPFLEDESGEPAMNAGRRALSRGANRLYQALLPGRPTAATPILRIYRSEALRGLEIRSSGFTVNAEILFALLRKGARVAEAPAALGSRRAGRSKLKVLPTVWSHLKLMAEILCWKMKPR